MENPTINRDALRLLRYVPGIENMNGRATADCGDIGAHADIGDVRASFDSVIQADFGMIERRYISTLTPEEINEMHKPIKLLTVNKYHRFSPISKRSYYMSGKSLEIIKGILGGLLFLAFCGALCALLTLSCVAIHGPTLCH
jgi:hypothetical protein